MNERNLVICDSEIHYAYGLGENISGRNELAVRVFVCTDLNKVRRFQEKKQIHILVLGENVWKEKRDDIYAEQVFVLTSEIGIQLAENETEVYRFQSADAIFAKILEIYSDRTNHNVLKHVRKANQKMIAVYSPIHRIGKTTFALALGKELSNYSKTLYINMESYADINGRIKSVNGKNLGDLFYYIKQEKGNVALRLSMMVSQIGNLDYVSPMRMSSDLHEIKLEEWEILFTQILENTIYENIVLDLGEGIQGLFGILQMCNKIYMPVLEDMVSAQKLAQYDENLQILKLKNVQQNTYRFTVVDNMEEYARKLIKGEQ